MKQRVRLHFELETPGGSEPEGKAKAAALVRYSSRKPNHSNADNIPWAECTQQEIQLIFFALISDSQNGLLDRALSSALQGCVTFCRPMQLLQMKCQSAPPAGIWCLEN